ncbi:hypothetical protein ACVWYH_005026 [Bradyrhizobium sp. GM24.11]
MDDLQREDDNPNGRRPFIVDPLASLGLNLHPCPTGVQLFEARFPISLAESDRLIPEIDLLQLLEVQRRILYRNRGHHFIGGWALLTSVDQNGASQRRVHAWTEDKVGELIEPQPVDWLRWRSEREAMHDVARKSVVPHLNRHERRKLTNERKSHAR